MLQREAHIFVIPKPCWFHEIVTVFVVTMILKYCETVVMIAHATATIYVDQQWPMFVYITERHIVAALLVTIIFKIS